MTRDTRTTAIGTPRPQSLAVSITSRTVLAGVFLALVSSARVAGAQRPSFGDLRLLVLDSLRAPVVNAEVSLSLGRSQGGVVRTDSMGVAAYANLTSGLWLVQVRRIGLKPMSISVRVDSGTNQFTVIAQSAALQLSGFRVVGGREYSQRLDDFERRRLSGAPSAVVTSQQIERLGPIVLSRMLRDLSGVRIGDSLGSTVAISTRGSKPTPLPNRPGFAMVQCVMRVSVDGILLPALYNIDQIPPKDVHGVEVYFGPARLPPELAGLRTDNWCGVIAVWTRDR